MASIQCTKDKAFVDLSATSPDAAGTVVGDAIAGLGPYRSMAIFANLQGAAGGTLDVYLQFTPDNGTTWVDYAHFVQMASGAAALTKVATVSKSGQQTTLTTVGTGNNPALLAGTVLGGEWGDQLRIVFVAGAGTSAGAAQTILLALSRNP